jgi:hypothetical protein
MLAMTSPEEMIVVASLENVPDIQALNPERLADNGNRIELTALQSSVPPEVFSVLQK